VRFEFFHFALIRRAHRTPRSIHHHRDVLRRTLPRLLAQLGEFPKTRFEQALHRTRRVARIDGALEEFVEIAAAPEILFKLVGLPRRALERENL
jgi:hypothetical protein